MVPMNKHTFILCEVQCTRSMVYKLDSWLRPYITCKCIFCTPFTRALSRLLFVSLEGGFNFPIHVYNNKLEELSSVYPSIWTLYNFAIHVYTNELEELSSVYPSIWTLYNFPIHVYTTELEELSSVHPSIWILYNKEFLIIKGWKQKCSK